MAVEEADTLIRIHNEACNEHTASIVIDNEELDDRDYIVQCIECKHLDTISHRNNKTDGMLCTKCNGYLNWLGTVSMLRNKGVHVTTIKDIEEYTRIHEVKEPKPEQPLPEGTGVLKIGAGLSVHNYNKPRRCDSLIDAFKEVKSIPKSNAEIEYEQLKKKLNESNQWFNNLIKKCQYINEKLNEQKQENRDTKGLHIDIAKQLLEGTGYTVDKVEHEDIGSMKITIGVGCF